MIPKKIHYCWFGGNPLPDLAVKCIDSWKKFFPDYEIKEWNESNFDLNICDYVKEAYEAKKWAFVSDYARFWILYHEGGLYFDTDVEVIKSFDDILSKGGFMGQEAEIPSNTDQSEVNIKTKKFDISVNPGLGIGVAPGLQLYKEILNYYNTLHFMEDGVMNTTTICTHTTKILKGYGYDESKEEIQEAGGITIYPPEYFCPQNSITGELKITKNTHSIHYYTASWYSKWERIIEKIMKCKNRSGIEYTIRKMVSLPFCVISKIDELGLKKAIKYTLGITKKDS